MSMSVFVLVQTVDDEPDWLSVDVFTTKELALDHLRRSVKNDVENEVFDVDDLDPVTEIVNEVSMTGDFKKNGYRYTLMCENVKDK